MKNIEKESYSFLESDPGSDQFFNKVEISYEKHKDEIWQEVSGKLDNKYNPDGVKFVQRKSYLAIAAVLIVLIGIASFMRFYNKTIESTRGNHVFTVLPDGSSAELNAESSLVYYPFWWRFSREVFFEGEGFFEVVEGKDFIVSSSNGSTRVLGTSFNIYSRDNNYRVTCFTGTVMVISKSKKESVITPDYMAEVNDKGEISVEKLNNPEITVSWIDNMFIFTSTPLKKVIHEIERQYDVNIHHPDNLNYLYTGNFPRDIPVDKVLDLVCKPFGLSFVQSSEREYQIIQN